jgi:hypothetical protein
MVVTLIGTALLIATIFVVGLNDRSEDWLFLAAEAFIAISFMLVGSGIPGRYFRLGEALFVATPGALLAAVGFTVLAYFQPSTFSVIFVFTWVSLMFLGLLWIIVGPIFMYRAKTRLWVSDTGSDAGESVGMPKPGTDRSGSHLVVARWFLVAATLLGSIASWL